VAAGTAAGAATAVVMVEGTAVAMVAVAMVAADMVAADMVAAGTVISHPRWARARRWACPRRVLSGVARRTGYAEVGARAGGGAAVSGVFALSHSLAKSGVTQWAIRWRSVATARVVSLFGARMWLP
jgi:hypothetical protein